MKRVKGTLKNKGEMIQARKSFLDPQTEQKLNYNPKTLKDKNTFADLVDKLG